MKMRILYYSILALALAGCGLFETRSPEEPESGGENMPPATSPALLADNFTRSFNRKSLEDYMNCIADSGFTFQPAADAAARYPALFKDWNASDERRYLLSFFAQAPNTELGYLTLSKVSYEAQTPDSAIYAANYDISFEASASAVRKSYSGSLRLIMKPASTGLWTIWKWQDFSRKADSTNAAPESWSALKAAFHN